MKTEKPKSIIDDQEFYNEIMREAYEAEEKHKQDIDDKNCLVIKSMLEIKGFDFVSKFLHDYVVSECHGEITLCEKPTGNQQSNTWGASKGVWVNQHCEMEDSYWGEIYFPVGENNWLKCPFAC